MKKLLIVLASAAVLFGSAYAKDNKSSEKNSEVLEKTKNKASEIGNMIGDALKTGINKTEEALNKNKTKIVTGTLHVRGEGKNALANIELDDGTKYVVKTISNSEDSMIKLAGYNGKRIKVSGVLNTETNEMTLTTYKLAKDDDKDDDSEE